MDSQPVAPAAVAPAVANVADLVRAEAARRPDAEALVSTVPVRRALTFGQLDARVHRVAAGLAAHGLVAGHRVALLGGNSLELAVGYLAVLRAGFVAVPLDPSLAADELDRLLADCGARLVLADPDRRPGVAVPVLPLTPDGLDAVAATSAAAVDSPRDPEALAALLYTAGTSGSPRAAMLTHRALLASLAQVGQVNAVAAGDTVLGALPLFHVFGLNAVLGGALAAGARLVLTTADAAGILAVVRAEGVQHAPLAPSLLEELLDDPRSPDLAAVSVISGAAPLPAALAEAFQTRTGARLGQGYGLTEAGPGVALAVDGLHGPGHVGRPLPGVEVRVGDGDDPGEPGEIAIRGANLFSGYWPDGGGAPGPDGWFGTGDVGYLDEAGELYLVDRAGELVEVAGFAVYPAEVEQVIAELPGVDAVAVVGGAPADNRLVAFVTGDIDPDAVLAHCRSRLVRFKQPARVEVLDDLPRGATGKVRKGLLRESLRR